MNIDGYRKLIKLYSHIITIDPGARENGGTGLAVFQPDYKRSPFPVKNWLLKSKEPEWLKKVDDIADMMFTFSFGAELNYSKPLFFIERPKFFDNFKGQTAATSDSLFKLCFLTGRLYGVIRSLNLDCVLLPIADWKGQLDKKKIEKRIESICGSSHVHNDDRDDAVGMGLFLKGYF